VFKHKILSMVLLVGLVMGQSVPPAYAATYCDQAQFVSDITAPDGASFAPGASFTKTWRFLNIGSCTWMTSYKLVYTGGDAMGSTTTVNLPVNVAPGQMLDISVNLTAPSAIGHFKSLWKFTNASGVQFGIGNSASDAFWVDINVVSTDAVIYDFVANAPYAIWKSGAGTLLYPGTSGDSRGFAYQVDRPHLEDDSYDSLPGLLTVPQNKYNGYIQATYPEFQVQQGDKLQTLVNCEFGATGCYVTFRIDYLLPNGLQKKFWEWKEAYDKRFYRANIDLSPLAGQKVRFVFMLLATGSASGDRALWGAPRIVRAGTVQPPALPATLTPLPPLTATPTPIIPPPPTVAPVGCDRAAYVTDVNVPDGTIFAPGAAFSKTWRLKNSGSCTWTKDYRLTYYSGEVMNAQVAVHIPLFVYPGETVDLTVNMTAPGAPGSYRSYWILANASGKIFGIGTNADNPFWVEINVAGESPQENGYDFWTNVCAAQWKSGAGNLPCPGTDGDRNGFVIADGFSHLEDGTMGPLPTLLMSPQNKYNGYIQGFYPAITVQPGDHFHTVVGCDYGYSCNVTFRLDYMNPNGYIGNFWQRSEYNDKKNYTVDVDLTPLAGRSVRFILTILATGSATGDRVRWGKPMLVHAGNTAPATSIPATSTPLPPATFTPLSPSPTSTPSTMSEWLTYTNPTYGFEFKYPPQSQISNQQNNFVHIGLPIQPGTNLGEKYLETVVTENPSICQSPFATSSMLVSSETVNINGISYLKQTGGDAGAGNFYDWVAYSTSHTTNCISMGFVLHSHNPGNYNPPVPVFDKAAESAVFLQIMQTLAWASSAPTNTPTPASNPGTIIPSPRIDELHMIDASNGWALGASYLLRTSDGGLTWYSVLPGDVPSAGFFPTAMKCWVITGSSQTSPGPGPGSLYFTNNGGLNWTRFDVPFNGGSIQFLDDNTGYVLQITGAAMQKQSVVLYKTTDGGATWTLNYNNDPTVPGASNTLPLGGHKNGITFSNATTGWVGGDTPTDGYFYFYKTSDSGVTWSRLQLALPAGYESAYITTTAPKFFGVNDGILPVWMGIGIGMRDLFLYVTHDGGNTWTPSSSYARNAEYTDIISMSNTISWDWAHIFHATSNSGSSWATITPDVNFGDDFRELDFVSTSTGWVRQQHADESTSLYRTMDGGTHWTLLFGAKSETLSPTPVPVTATSVPPTAVSVPATATSVPASATPVSLIGPYAVIRVAQGDVLNIRQSAGVSYPVVGSFAPDATNIMRTGATASADGADWVEVQNPGGGTGWVNSNYLTEYVTRESFCADTRVASLIEQLKASVNQSDGGLLSQLVSPPHGMNVHLWAYADPVSYTAGQAAGAYTNTEIFNWGAGPRGEPDYGTFKDIIQPKLLETLNAPNLETYCDSLDKVYPLSQPWPYAGVHYYNLYKPASGETFDFRTWLIGIEYYQGQPYIYGMVNIVWEP
jgi:photosystem II stability/assembly factor-like uncharacterized protein